MKRGKRKREPYTSEEQWHLNYHDVFDLKIELVPSSTWGLNARIAVGKRLWDEVRYKVFRKARQRCQICKAKPEPRELHCHEVWAYDDESKEQRLENLLAVCVECHDVIHFARTRLVGDEEEAFRRFVKINDILSLEAADMIRTVFKRAKKRSRIKWRVRIGHLKEYGINPIEIQNGEDKLLLKRSKLKI